MQQLLQGMAERVKAFVEGTDHIALIVTSPAEDALPLINIFEQVEASSASDLFWTFNDDFVDPVSYASAVVSAFAVKHAAIKEAMAADGMSPWPAIPEHLLSDATPPADRLRGLAAFSRELLPVPNGGNNVWIFYPLAIAAAPAFAALMSQVLAHEFPFPWCHHLRFIVREEPSLPALSQVLSGRPRIDVWRPDLSPETVNAALSAQVEDESLPLNDRMGTLMIAAGSDFALHRYDAAMQKYELLLRYHAPLGNLAMAAVALNGMGETYERMGDIEQANAAYQAALVPASDGDPPAIPVLLNIVMNLGNLRMTQQRWDEAEGYWDSAQQLAAAARNAPLRVQALEQRGICEERQHKLEAAEKSYDAAAIMAAKIEDLPLCRSALGRLGPVYQRLGRETEAWGVSTMLAEMGGPA
jgi:tetratricopeptide (TPR) repeat protein